MIRIGLTSEQKIECLSKYLAKHSEIKEVIIFSSERFFLDLSKAKFKVNIRQIGYQETIMYRTFYPLLEEINDTYLLVTNECMRTDNRSDLHYNCIAKYTNQTPHRVVFEWFPIISELKDFMILLDFSNSQKYKGLSLSEVDLDAEDVLCVPRKISLSTIDVELPPNAQEEYEQEKEKLFDNIGNKNPDTIPRQLHIWTGQFKKSYILATKQYVARNSRFKSKNITTFKDTEKRKKYILLDMPHRRLDFNDFLRQTEQTELAYISTGFGVDKAYIAEFNEWEGKVEEFYAKTGIYK